MGDILILDEDLINKIAAGEVVERPASIVKELIENAIDAGASYIEIEAKEAGKSYIRVTDDGSGMDEEDAKISWLRHTTSKLKSKEDLFNISSLGFRGGALASIAAVSRLEIKTKKETQEEGIRIVVEGGKEILTENIGLKTGTTIEVKNLFYNTPVRKQYLKTIEIELRHLTDIVTRYALIHPKIHIRFTHNSTEVINSPPAKDLLTNISFIYGAKMAKDLLPIDYEEGQYKITGFISKPSLSKASKNDQSIYVNKRYIKTNATITNALNNAYHTMMMVNRYPVAILDIKLNPDKTDVNVHPQKSEIRIKNENVLYDAVFEAVSLSLKGNDLIPEKLSETNKKLNDFTPKLDFKTGMAESVSKYPLTDTEQTLLVKETNEVKTESAADSKIVNPSVVSSNVENSLLIKILGVVNKTYILAEVPGNILLIDQHAAAERILYEKFTEQLKEKSVSVQELLKPEILEVNPRQFSVINANKELFENFGYNIVEFGHNTVMVISIPVLLGRQFDKTMFLDFIDDIEKHGKPKSLETFFHERIARMSCRTAIKAGDEITLPQIKDYVRSILTNDFPATCPHGRPITIKWSFYELEKMFKRIV